MNTSRRKFLKFVGASAFILAAKPINNAVAAKGALELEDIKKPLTAKRWGMVVDIEKWQKEDAEKIVNACHQAHNVPNFENPKDEIKWIWEEKFGHAFPAHEGGLDFIKSEVRNVEVPVFCNQCDNPPCVRACPTQATWKRESDGIVMMDMHRCIGCRYCIVACPYGSRSFNWRDPRQAIEGELNPLFPTRERGVVEKCNFCADRLSRGLMPACVEACRHGALTFGDLDDPNSDIRRLLDEQFAIRRKVNLGTQPNVFYLV